MNVPVLVEPVGDPVGVRVAVRRLLDAAASIDVVARGLSDLNQQAVQVWESQAQRLFSFIADQFGQVIAGSGGVASDLAAALDRYAGVLEVCQGEVRVCRQRLNDLVASTPVGMVPDPVAVNSLVGKANQAYARAGQAARELSAVVLGLIGGPSAHGQVPVAGEAHASFVSHAHRGGLASTHPSAAGFDVQAAQIQSQMTGVIGSLTGLVTAETRPTTNPGIYPSSTMIGGSNFSSAIGSPGAVSGAGLIGGINSSPIVNLPSNIAGSSVFLGAGLIGGSTFFSDFGRATGFLDPEINAPIFTNHQMKLFEAIENNRASDPMLPNNLGAYNTINNSENDPGRVWTLPPGWELVRHTSYF